MMPKAMVAPGANGLQELKIEGLFPHPHWMVFLLSGLAEHQVSVVGGHAAQQMSHAWNANFQLDFRRSAMPPASVDYVALAGKRVAHMPTSPPRLHMFQVRRRPDNGLEINVNGPDQIGFLGKLLSEISLLALYPTEMEITTQSGQIEDFIVFRGIGGTAPGDNVEASLTSLLQTFVENT